MLIHQPSNFPDETVVMNQPAEHQIHMVSNYNARSLTFSIHLQMAAIVWGFREYYWQKFSESHWASSRNTNRFSNGFSSDLVELPTFTNFVVFWIEEHVKCFCCYSSTKILILISQTAKRETYGTISSSLMFPVPCLAGTSMLLLMVLKWSFWIHEIRTSIWERRGRIFEGLIGSWITLNCNSHTLFMFMLVSYLKLGAFPKSNASCSFESYGGLKRGKESSDENPNMLLHELRSVPHGQESWFQWYEVIGCIQ